ncbi:DUF397 domain-containing protein [Streptomyces spongiae]|uniref:DUF397 domain-containing protein n=1 Tax=Streptomyces spongiae TaxID=565072 RepID=A0A5N8XDF2_9ACTN|nr:DUF397 domain-containing protein [Streptomyces spongiae]MPY57224.1 DUF397 domain-containing protein [Streptomyces spongiae]
MYGSRGGHGARSGWGLSSPTPCRTLPKPLPSPSRSHPHIRDSKVRSGPVLTVPPQAWVGFVRLAADQTI